MERPARVDLSGGRGGPEAFWGYIWSSWCLLGSLGGVLGHLGDVSGASRGRLGATSARLGVFRGSLGPLLLDFHARKVANVTFLMDLCQILLLKNQ